MRTRSDGKETRARILATASEVFGELGYHKATFAEMARRGGFSPGLINFHFCSKDDLYRMVWKTLQQRVRERRPADGELPDDAPPLERLRAHIFSTLNRLCDADLNALHRIDMQERVNATGLVQREGEDDMRKRRAHMRAAVRDLLGDGASEEDVDLCEMSVVHQMFVLRRPWRNHGKPGHGRGPHGHDEHHKHPFRFSRKDVDRLTEHITRFSLGGIAAVSRTHDNEETTSS